MTPRPLLPPRGVFLPTHLVFDRQLNPSALQTWAQLRALAWGQQETPILSLRQLTELTGKKPSTLYGHMAILRDRGALRWRPAGSGTLIVSFEHILNLSNDAGEALSGASAVETLSGACTVESPALSNVSEAHAVEAASNSEKLEKPALNPSSLDRVDAEKGEERGRRFQHSRKNPQSTRKKLPKSGKQEDESSAAIRLYRRLTRIAPNPSQRTIMRAAVTDLGRWQASLEHWLSHAWNPRNLPGLLELYARGGPAACRYCLKSRPNSQAKALTPLDQNFSAIDDLRKELNRE